MSETIYSTVPNLKEVEQESKDSLVSFLRNNPGRFYTARKLAVECGFPKTQTYPELRRAIKELVAEGHSIVSTIKGFVFVDKTTESGRNMLRVNIIHFEQRIKGMQRSINDLRAML